MRQRDVHSGERASGVEHPVNNSSPPEATGICSVPTLAVRRARPNLRERHGCQPMRNVSPSRVQKFHDCAKEHPLAPPRPPWCAPGRRSSSPGHPCSLASCICCMQVKRDGHSPQAQSQTSASLQSILRRVAPTPTGWAQQLALAKSQPTSTGGRPIPCMPSHINLHPRWRSSYRHDQRDT